jgi:hypothetical protein
MIEQPAHRAALVAERKAAQAPEGRDRSRPHLELELVDGGETCCPSRVRTRRDDDRAESRSSDHDGTFGPSYPWTRVTFTQCDRFDIPSM